MKDTTIRNGNLFCNNCGDEQKITYPINPTMFSAMAKAFDGIHKTCKKTWVQPEVKQGLSEREKMKWWLENGERGVSSETMFEIIGEYELTSSRSHPLDPDDFRRCYLLLQAIPEWKSKLYLLKTESKVWNNLVDNWDKLTEMLEEQLETKKANGMYEFMESLGC